MTPPEEQERFRELVREREQGERRMPAEPAALAAVEPRDTAAISGLLWPSPHAYPTVCLTGATVPAAEVSTLRRDTGCTERLLKPFG